MKHQLQKVTNLRNDEVYYTYADWAPKFIEGKKFIPIFRNPLLSSKIEPFYMNAESLKITAVSTVDSTKVS